MTSGSSYQLGRRQRMFQAKPLCTQSFSFLSSMIRRGNLQLGFNIQGGESLSYDSSLCRRRRFSNNKLDPISVFRKWPFYVCTLGCLERYIVISSALLTHSMLTYQVVAQKRAALLESDMVHYTDNIRKEYDCFP